VVDIAGRMLLATVAHNFRDVAGFHPPAFTVVPPASSSATTLQKVKLTLPATLDQVRLLPRSQSGRLHRTLGFGRSVPDCRQRRQTTRSSLQEQ
jgi:hypothetical protein